MAFVKPTIHKINADIRNTYVYLRAVRKWGKTTTWKNIILQKFDGDASRGLLVQVGNEHGITMLDNINATHVSTYKDLMELKDWLINENGKEHNIEMVCFDTVDELPEIFDKEVIRISNIENPTRPCKSIKSALGGYNAGPEMSAQKIKAYLEEIKQAGFGIMCIGHTKMKAISDRATTDDERWMTLTGALTSNYEAAVADVCDIILTGNIEREFETKGEGENAKTYIKSEERRLYFRGNELIAAGGRFAQGSVPDYIVFDGSAEDFASTLIETIEKGMEGSKSSSAPSTKKAAKKKKSDDAALNVVVDDDDDEDVYDFAVKAEDASVPFDMDEVDLDVIRDEIRALHKAADDATKKKAKKKMTEIGGTINNMGYDELMQMKSVY